VLEIVISERGTVDSAILRDSVAAFYDDPLLGAAMNWRFKPATRNGQPVKYRKLLEIVHSPR
jgi:TonB family protein